MLLVLITGLILTLVGLSLATRVTAQYSSSSNDVFAANASLVAEAGIEQTLDQLNTSSSFTGYSTNQTFFNNTKQGYGIFTTTVYPGSVNQKIIVSTGKVFRTHSATTPVKTRTIRVTVVGTTSSGYSVYSGPGGLLLSGSAAINNSSVYVNGGITMSGAATIGSNNQPLTVTVANMRCPHGGASPYPQQCADGSQPISMSGSPHIYGSVCATGQTSNTNISGGNSGSGLQIGCTAPTVSQPTYDRLAQVNAVTTTKTSSDSSIDCTQWQSGSGFARTWPANLKITGNVNIGNSCNLTISGNVYVTGNLTISGAAKIHVADSVGTTRPVILVDGTINAGGSGSVSENGSGTSIEFITFKSADGCTTSNSAPCSSIPSTDLYNSQSLQTINVNGAGNFPGVIFDAYWSEVTISGSGTMGSAIGQTVNLSGAGTVTFGTSLASGQATWTIRSYQDLH